MLSELDDALGCPGGGGVATPLTNLTAWSIDAPYLLSGASVTCANPSHSRRVYRLTPRCLDDPAGQCPHRPNGLAAGGPALLHVFSGVDAMVVPDGCWWMNSGNSSAAGFWIRAP